MRACQASDGVRVLVVEDEVKLAGLIRGGLREEGLLADVAVKGEDALWMARPTAYDVIVLDVMLPGIDGFATCRRLREDGVCAARPDADRARRRRGPDRRARRRRRRLPRQAVRLRRAARARCARWRGGVPSSGRPCSRVGDLELDPATRACGAAGTEISLSAKEFQLLEVFMRRPGRGAVALPAARARLGRRRTSTART